MVYVVDREFLYDDKFAAIGDNVTISCHGSIIKPVVWQYKSPVELNARDLYDEHGLVSAYIKKFAVDALTYDLTVRNVTVDNAGEYWCVEDEGFGVKHITTLFVTGIVQLL